MNKKKFVGCALILFGVVDILSAFIRFKSAESQLARAFGITDKIGISVLVFGMIIGLIGIILLASNQHTS